MNARKDFPEFRFKGMAVGEFSEPTEPQAPGRYAYQKYRSPGHLRMQQELQSGKPAKCEYTVLGRRVRFTVRAEPEYGVLELEAIK